MQVARSYGFDHFRDEDRRSESRRLHAQATVLLSREVAQLQALGLVPGRIAVEIGCGPGFVTGAMADLATPARTVGVDVSEELLAIARTIVMPEHQNLTFIEGNAYALPFAAD